MSYNIEQCDSAFFIPSDNTTLAFQALKKACTEQNLFDGLKKMRHLENAVHEFGWELEFDENENVIEIHLLKDYLEYEDELFDTLAPYIKADSFIQMVGEDHELWRWHFNGKECIHQKPTLIWKEVEDNETNR